MLLLIGSFCAAAPADERLTVWGPPPREKPHFTKGAEGFPPLPLPVVPQRRTEKKRPPAPPMLIANLARFSFRGWKGSPGAVDHLLNNAKKHLKVWYGWEQLDIGEVVRKHAAKIEHRTPILYLCAYYPLDLTSDQRHALRAYVLGGGTLLINCCGQREALASAEAELAVMFPGCPLRPLPLDHAVYHAYYDIEKVRYPVPSDNPLDGGAEQVEAPRLRGVTLGTRAAVIVSLEDLASGWNEWHNPGVPRVHAQDSTRLGLNLITYVTAENRYARFLARTREIAGPSVRPRTQLVFPQLIHDGNWNPNPSAVPFFLKEIGSNTSVAVRFERKTMEIKDPALFEHPLLYMTGSWNPSLSREEQALLHRYLTTGGTLLADAAAGSAEFDVAFRALCRQLFPESPLAPLPSDHPLFTCFHTLDKLTLHHEREPIAPLVEAVTIDGRPVILYSRYGLCDGWAHQFSTYARCYTTDDALKLGTNLVVFVMQ
ncbi:MAG: DUF4159 domain-containing protein [Phycisphaerae bacterium]|nr:DUF4159 domain-containing protein [Phycisphaerae bacterium]